MTGGLFLFNSPVAQNFFVTLLLNFDAVACTWNVHSLSVDIFLLTFPFMDFSRYLQVMSITIIIPIPS